jgi:hypothetical protein
MLIRAGLELEMPKRRVDILERARAIMQAYGDEQLWKNNIVRSRTI